MRTRPTSCGTHRAARRATAALVVAAASGGCRGDAAGPTTRSAAGTWALALVNEAPLPFTYGGSRSGTNALAADTLVLAPGGAASAVAYVQGGAGPPAVLRSAGTWTQVGDTVRLVWPTLPGQRDTARAVQQTAVQTAPDQLASPWGLGYVDTDPYGTGVVYEDPRLRWVRAR